MERTNEDVAVLIAQGGPLNGQRWYLRTSIIVGRDPECDVIIADRQISRQHVRVTPTKDGAVLEDLGSKNGCFWNGVRVVEPVLLKDGDVLQLALAQQFTYISSDATLPLEGDFLGGTETQRRLRLDRRSHRVWTQTQEVAPPLSVSQYKLLEILYDNQGRVVGRQKLIEYIWGVEQAVNVSEQALDALVRRLRERLASIDPNHTYLTTVRGHGLRLDNPTE